MADNNKEQSTTIKPLLNPGEEDELSKGQALYEMDKNNPGWQIVREWLNVLAFHTWVNPAEAESKEKWEWQELNAYHAANIAKEILENIASAVSRSEYLDKVKSGEIERKRMTL